jgi:hypothetical protein
MMMAARGLRSPTSGRRAKLIEQFARRWGHEAGKGLPPKFKAHMSASVREGLLAISSLWEETLRGVETSARRLRRGVERRRGIGEKAGPARARRGARPGRGRAR